MAKYRRAVEPEEDVIEAAEEQQVEAQPLNAEEETFKKRYGDLRRHTQQLLQQKAKFVSQKLMRKSSSGQKNIPMSPGSWIQLLAKGRTKL